MWLHDHFGNFDSNFTNLVLDSIPPGYTVYTEYFFPDEVKQSYPLLEFKFYPWLFLYGNGVDQVTETAPTITKRNHLFQNFVSCFNRSNQSGRHLLLAKLNQLGWYNELYCSKHFALDPEVLESNGIDPAQVDPAFVNSINVFDFESPVDHVTNLKVLSPKIQACFVNIVAETKSLDTTVAFPTEKFLYAIANKRMWLAMAPPNYHKIVNQQFGFKLYSCFDYSFDSIWDPKDRLNGLLTALRPFAQMTQEQWQEIYAHQQEIIEYNYNRLVSFDFFNDMVDLEQSPVVDDIFRLRQYQKTNCFKLYRDHRYSTILPNQAK